MTPATAIQARSSRSVVGDSVSREIQKGPNLGDGPVKRDWVLQSGLLSQNLNKTLGS